MGNALDVFRGLEPSEQVLTVTFPYGFDGTFNRLFANEIDYGTLVPPPSSSLPYARTITGSNLTCADGSTTILTNFGAASTTDPTTIIGNASSGLQILQTGVYLIIVRQQFQVGGTTGGQRRANLLVNGAVASFNFGIAFNLGPTDPTIATFTIASALNANDLLGVSVFQDSTSSIISSTTNPCLLEAMKIG